MENRRVVASGPRLSAAVILLAFASLARAGPLMAVDFGGESIRVSLVKPGRNPITVVLNEASKRKSSSDVAFVDGQRLVGDEAALLSVRHPEKVYARTRDLLGKHASDASVQRALDASLLPYKIVSASGQRGGAGIETHTGHIYSAEELVASVLHYARSIAEAAAEGASILDCVITVPAFWGPQQRQALIDAAKIAGLNVLSLVNTHAAAALQFGIDRDFANASQLVLLYDMGAASTEAALVEFSAFRAKEGGVWKTIGQLEVKDVEWDAQLGGEALDMLLLNHFADEFEAAHPGLDLRSSPKAVAKLRKQVKRTKEVLSANTFAPISVEELMQGLDFRSRIERADFERLAAGFLERAAAPLRRLLARNSLAPGDLAAVEMLGGGSRVPAVKAALSAALGGRQLDMHLDADEAVVLGAGLVAANLSTTFRLRKFGLIDGNTYSLEFQLEEPDGVGIDSSLEGHFKPKALLPRMKRLPARRNVPLPIIPGAKALTARLSFNTTDPAIGLPPGVASKTLAEFEISGFSDVSDKYNQSGKPSLHIRADESGIVALEKAEAALEISEEYTVRVPVVAENSTEGEPAQAPRPGVVEDAASNETAANNTAPAEPAFEEVTRTRKRTIRVPLSIAGPGILAPGLSADALKASRRVLGELAAAEAARREAGRLKNELESYIIDFRGRLEGAEDVTAVTTAAGRDDFLARLEAAETWLYEEGEDEGAAAFRAKSKDLRGIGDPIELRAKELRALPRAVQAARDFLRVSRQAVGGWASTKPWLNATEVDALKAEMDAFEAWLAAETKQQSSRKPHEEPSLLSSSIDWRVEALRKPFNRLKAKKKPKPPKPAAEPAAGNETADGDGGTAAAPEEGPAATDGEDVTSPEPDHSEL